MKVKSFSIDPLLEMLILFLRIQIFIKDYRGRGSHHNQRQGGVSYD